VAVLKVVIEQLITLPAQADDGATLARYVLADWYKRNAGRFVFVPERLRLTFTPPQAYAFNMLLLAGKFDCDAAVMLSREIIRLIDPKI
jgi:hypothetical protein